MSIRARVLTAVSIMLVLAVGLGLLRGFAESGWLQAAFDAEFLSRPDGYPGLKEHYELDFPSPPIQMDPGLMYLAVAEGSVDVIDGYSTDGRIEAYDLIVLEDDENFFPPYDAAPLVRQALLDREPRIRHVLNELAGRLDAETMRRLNLEVDEQGTKARQVARQYLEQAHLLTGDPAESRSAPSITVGGKHFSEQEILGEMMALMLEHHLGLPVERSLNMGGTMICFNALKSGDIDLYAEYTGTGLVSILDRPAERDPQAVLDEVRKTFRQRWSLIWLEPFGFSNTYALVMRRERAKNLSLETISNLARYLEQGP